MVGLGALLACSVLPAQAQYADWNANPPKILPNERVGSGAIYSTGSGRQFPNMYAFAALRSNGSVVTWGVPSEGGDSSAVASSLSSNVTSIFSNAGAFAALKTNGSVVTWGDATSGGDFSISTFDPETEEVTYSPATGTINSNVTAVYSTGGAFAALKTDGSVVTWGADSGGGDSSAVAAELASNVTTIYSNSSAFAALKSEGSVVTWGSASFGGDSTSVAAGLASNVTAIYSNAYAFAAVKTDGSVITWGAGAYGGNSSAVAAKLTSNVKTVYSSQFDFAALKNDGSVVTWGLFTSSLSTEVANKLSSNVVAVYSTESAFAALKTDGSVVTWGNVNAGGDSTAVAASLTSNVASVYSTSSAFAALKTDGSVVAWGSSLYGGNSTAVIARLTSNVTAVYSSRYAFAALKADGSVVTWGGADRGGDSTAVADKLASNVRAVYSSQYAFAALKTDGSITAWGHPNYGGSGAPSGTGFNSIQSVIYIPSGASLQVSGESTDFTSTTATLLGEVVSEGTTPVTGRGFVYALATVTDPKIGDAGVTQVVDSGSGIGTYTTLLTGLTPNTAYVFRAYAVDEAGTTYGAAVNFSTNLPPVIISNGGNTNVSVSVAENSSAVSTITATDADTDQVIGYSIVGGTDAARFAVGSSSGVITFVAAPDFEAPADTNADNVYEVIVAATDNGNPPKSATQTLTITVSNVADNGVLAIEQPASTALASGGTASFGNLTIGQATELTFSYSSLGETALLMPSGAVITGAGASDYSLVSNLPAAVLIGGSGSFTVRFSPTTSGNRAAILSIPTNDTRPGRSPYTINLTGIGSATSTVATYANAANQVRGGWINSGNFTIGTVGTTNPANNWPSAEGPDKVVDSNTGSKFLIFRNSNAGLILSPTNANVVFNRLSLSTANDASERDPASYVIYGSTTALSGTAGTNISLAGLTELASGTITLPDNRTTGPTIVQFANTTAYASYIVAFPTVRSTTSNNITQISEVQLSQGINPPFAVAMAGARGGQLSSGTFTFGSIGSSNPGTNWLANESPDQAIDGSVSTKYLIFRNTGAGLIASPQAGPARVNNLSFWTANDSAERDPLTYEVYGFATAVTARSGTLNVTTNGTLLGSGTLTLPATRNAGPVNVTFANTTEYASYLVVFPTVKNSPSTTMMQIAEVQFGYNGPPDFALSAATITVAEDSGTYTGAGLATDITPGIGDIDQTVSFACANNNNALFSVQPAISPIGTLTFTPAADAFGTAVVNVIATDSTGLSSSAKTFNIEVTSVIDAPLLAAPTFSDISAYSATLQSAILNPTVADYSGKAIMYAPTAANSTLEYYGAGAVTIKLDGSSFSTSILNLLSSNTNYSVRACAYGPAGMIYSEVATFSTLPGLPVIWDNTQGLAKSIASLGGNGISTTQAIGYSFITGNQAVQLSTVTLGLNSSQASSVRLRLFEAGANSLPIGEPIFVHQEESRIFGSSGVYATIPLSGWQLNPSSSYVLLVDTTVGSAVWRKFSSYSTFESPKGWTSNTVVFQNSLGTSGSAASSHSFAIQITGTSLETYTHLELWRFANFGSYDSVDSGADSADPDGDGLSNLMEYALGLSPNNSGVIPAALSLSGANLEYTYTRSSEARDNGVTYQIEWSDTLTVGSWSTETVTEQITSTQGALETVKASIPKGTGGKRFLRLRVGAAPIQTP